MEKDRNKTLCNKALTRQYRETVVKRIANDSKFAKALFAEALNALLDGETDEALLMLRDLVHAKITFRDLAKQTGFDEKSLYRMLSRQGNPTTRNLFQVIKVIQHDLKLTPRVAA